MRNLRSIKTFSLILVAVFALSLVTVELHRSSDRPWFKYPGFLEADSEAAVTDNYSVTVEIGGVTHRSFLPAATPFVGRTTLLLNVYRAPPSPKA